MNNNSFRYLKILLKFHVILFSKLAYVLQGNSLQNNEKYVYLRQVYSEKNFEKKNPHLVQEAKGKIMLSIGLIFGYD